MNTVVSSRKIALTVSGIATLADVQRWVEIADAIDMPDSSPIEVSGVQSSLTVTAALMQITLPDELPPAHCPYDAACVLGEHDESWKHFDGKDAWS